MPLSLGPASPDELASFTALIEKWARREMFDNPVVRSVEHIADERRWLVRLSGEEKSSITIWLTLGQRTLQYETYFMPAPEENVATCWEYLLRVNRRLFAMRFAIGDEDAVYLTGQWPLSGLGLDELDGVVGGAYAYSEQYFPVAMSIGFASRYRSLSRRGG